MKDEPTTLLASEIDGVSPFNARKSPLSPEARAELKASVAEKGVIQPILLRREGKRVNALDGGSRWDVTRELLAEVDPADALRIERVGRVPVTWFEGTDAEAAEASLISFVQRSDLHPVDEFERFVELQSKHGFDAPRIAKETGKGLRFVQERLRLGRLAPVVRDAWRKGEIEADAAKAFAASESVEAQKALFKQLKKERRFYATAIRQELRRDHIQLDSREMIFIGVDAYVAAGGRLDEQIFEDQSFALDAALARQLVADKLEAEANRICAEEGWGIAILPGDPGDMEFDEAEDFDFADEGARAEELENINEFQRTSEQRAEYDAILTRAILRAVPQAERVSRAISIRLTRDGAQITRNLVRISPPDEDDECGLAALVSAPSPLAGEGGSRRSRETDEGSRPAQEPAGEPIRKGARMVLDETINAALQASVESWPELAMTYAVAAMGCFHRCDAAIDLAMHPRRNFEPKHAVTVAIAKLSFPQALKHCAQVGYADLIEAFGELVGAAIDAGRIENLDAGLLLVATARDYDARQNLVAQFDAQAYFDASTKQTAIDAVRDMVLAPAVANELAGMKKNAAAERAALTAKDYAWLPKPLAEAAPEQPEKKPDTRSTAQAMADAIDADEARKTRDPFADFMDTFTVRRVGAKIKSKTLYALYLNRMGLEDVEPMSVARFGEAIAERGIAKKRTADGIFYLDLDLADHVRLAEAAQ